MRKQGAGPPDKPRYTWGATLRAAGIVAQRPPRQPGLINLLNELGW